MTADLEFTGERFVPGIPGEIAYEHAHRYGFARAFVAGKRVVDAACGEGYGSALLAATAADVIGVDLDAATIAHAGGAYAGRPNLSFRCGSVTALPLPEASADVVVSFETIEHLDAADQPRMLAEFARVLAPGGVLVLSAPNRVEYSEARGVANPFHKREHDRAELAALVSAAFPAQRWYRQRVWLGSSLWSEDGGAGCEMLVGDGRAVAPAPLPAAMYFVVVAARATGDLPSQGAALSLLSDADETELRRHVAQAAEVLRLDGLLRERDLAAQRRDHHVAHLEQLVAERESLVEQRDASLAARAVHVAHLEELVAVREQRVAERDAQLSERAAHVRHLEGLAAARDTSIAVREAEIGSLQHTLAETQRNAAAAGEECQRLERAIAAQERIIDYRQSYRWWFALPWLRLRLWWKRVTGGGR